LLLASEKIREARKGLSDFFLSSSLEFKAVDSKIEIEQQSFAWFDPILHNKTHILTREGGKMKIFLLVIGLLAGAGQLAMDDTDSYLGTDGANAAAETEGTSPVLNAEKPGGTLPFTAEAYEAAYEDLVKGLKGVKRPDSLYVSDSYISLVSEDVRDAILTIGAAGQAADSKDNRKIVDLNDRLAEGLKEKGSYSEELVLDNMVIFVSGIDEKNYLVSIKPR